MALVSLREYSRLKGVSLAAVQKAIATGRIAVAKTEQRGQKTRVWIDPVQANKQWQLRTDPVQQRVATRADMGKGPQTPAKKIKALPDVGEEDAPAPQSISKNATGAGGETYSRARGMKEIYSAKLEALEYKKKIGHLVEIDKVKIAFYNAARTVQQNILNVPSRVSALLAAESDEKKIFDLLNSELKSALRELADGNITIK